MQTPTDTDAFLDALNERADVAPHVRKAIVRAHRGAVPVLRAHELHATRDHIVEVAEWLRVPKSKPRFVAIAWRIDGARVTYEAFATLREAAQHAHAAHKLSVDTARAVV